MKIFLVILLSSLFSSMSLALPEIGPECEKKIFKEVLKNKQSTLFLDFEILETSEDLFNDLVKVGGFYSDAENDYQYGEHHLVTLSKGSCEILAVEFLEDFEY